jgi:hypothetical protein
MIPKESAVAWLAHLRATHPTFPFRVAAAFLPPNETKNLSVSNVNDSLGRIAILDYLGTKLTPSSSSSASQLIVAVIGLPNVRYLTTGLVHYPLLSLAFSLENQPSSTACVLVAFLSTSLTRSHILRRRRRSHNPLITLISASSTLLDSNLCLKVMQCLLTD